MDTVHVVSKRIEQLLEQLRREFRRYGRELPETAFYVHSGVEISVQVAEDAPEPKAIVQPVKAPPAPAVETVERPRKRSAAQVEVPQSDEPTE